MKSMFVDVCKSFRLGLERHEEPSGLRPNEDESRPARGVVRK